MPHRKNGHRDDEKVMVRSSPPARGAAAAHAAQQEGGPVSLEDAQAKRAVRRVRQPAGSPFRRYYERHLATTLGLSFLIGIAAAAVLFGARAATKTTGINT
jgi:hypothetical protein